jgi:hypothetical protein
MSSSKPSGVWQNFVRLETPEGVISSHCVLFVDYLQQDQL